MRQSMITAAYRGGTTNDTDLGLAHAPRKVGPDRPMARVQRRYDVVRLFRMSHGRVGIRDAIACASVSDTEEGVSQ